MVHEPPKDLAFNFSETLFQESIPEPLRNFFRERIKISPLAKVDKGWRLVLGQPLTPCRGIFIEFGDHEFTPIYHLFEMKTHILNEEKRLVAFEHTLPDKPPDPEQFAAWIYQSLNQASKQVLDRIQTDVYFAGATKSMFVTKSEFVSDLFSLRQDAAQSKSVGQDIAHLALNLELPLVGKVSLADLVSIRQNEQGAFEEFRLRLQSELRCLRHIDDEAKRAAAVSDVQHELEEVQVRAVENEIKRVRAELIGEFLVGAASMAAVVPTGGLSVLGMIAAGAGAYKTLTKAKHGVTKHPAYFLWKLRRSGG